MATVKTLGFIGKEFNLLIKQGGTFKRHTARYRDKTTGLPINLTGCTVSGQIRKKANDTALVASFSTAITNATNGEFQFWIPDEVTATIPAGETIEDTASKYVYDLEIVDSAGETTPLLYGTATVFRGVTRA